MADLLRLGPLDQIINVGWPSGVFVVVKFTSEGDDTVSLTKDQVSNVTVPFTSRRVTTTSTGAVTGTNWYSWHIESQAYVTGSDGGTGRILIPLGTTGAATLEQALTGINIHGVAQRDLFFGPFVDEAAADADALARNAADDVEFALASAHPADGGFLRHRYTSGSIEVTTTPPPPITVTETVFLVRVPTVKQDGKSVIKFTTLKKCSLVARVYPISRHEPFPTDTSGPAGFPDFPIRLKSDESVVPSTLLWYIKQAPPGDDLPSALPAGSYTMSVKRAAYKNTSDDKIVQLYSVDFHYDILSYRDPDDVLQAAPTPTWKNLLGAPPHL